MGDAWSQYIAIWVVLVGVGRSWQYKPVSSDRRIVVSPACMGSVLARLVGSYALYCSGAVLPSPLPDRAGLLVLSVRT